MIEFFYKVIHNSRCLIVFFNVNIGEHMKLRELITKAIVIIKDEEEKKALKHYFNDSRDAKIYYKRVL
tara:strand:- start:9918 stop:10121 length:204 start_codon:yes stop_codon:yes gene_type:complete